MPTQNVEDTKKVKDTKNKTLAESGFESVRYLCKSCEWLEAKVIDLKTDNEQFTRLETEFEAQTKNFKEVNTSLKSEWAVTKEN